jgi:uncharacterized membrane protein
MNRESLVRLPRRVLVALVAITVVAAIAAMASGFLPPRSWSSFVLPLYLAGLLLALTLAYVVSGNTLMHHHRTGTVRRDSSPAAFRSIVLVQLGLAAALLVFGFIQLGRVA